MRQQKQTQPAAKLRSSSTEPKDVRKLEESTPKKATSVVETPKKDARSGKGAVPRGREPGRNGQETSKEMQRNRTKEPQLDIATGVEEIPLPENEIRMALRSPHIAVADGKVMIDYGSYPRQDTLEVGGSTGNEMLQPEATPSFELSSIAVPNYNPNFGYNYELPETNGQEQSGLSYGKVFGMSAYDYAFDFVPPKYRRHRRHSDSDSESVRNFMSANMPIHGILELEDKKPTPVLQPMKWISKKTRKKSEDQRKKPFPVR